MWLITSPLGAYVVQTFLHSLISILIIERSLQIWQITRPRFQFRYRIMTLILPVTMIPLYQLLSPSRGSFAFREGRALMNIHRWLSFEIWDVLPLGTIFLGLLGVTAVIFFVQEIIPVVRDLAARAKGAPLTALPPDDALAALTRDLSSRLGIEPPPLSLIDDPAPYIFASGTSRHTIVLSSGLLATFDADQVRCAIAHELAHIARRSNAMSWAIFIVRLLMFYNPIVLVVFRRIVQDDEHSCDDITVSLTGKPKVLATILDYFYSSYADLQPTVSGGVAAFHDGMEHYGQRLLLKERITRLEQLEPGPEERFEWSRFFLTIAAVVALNYFVM